MSEVNMANVDLNLLNVLATVLELRSATHAARKLNVTQSAVSNALRRARAVFGEPLLVRTSHGLEPTPRGAALASPLRAWLEEARRLIAEPAAFEPRRSGRTFRIACSDAVAIALLAPLLRLLSQRAPAAKLRLVTLDRLISEDGLARGEVDLLVGMPPLLPRDHEAEPVYRDMFACVVRRDHPSVRGRLTLAAFSALPHVDLALFDSVDDTIDRALARHGRTRQVQVALPHFSSVPLAVLESDGIATLSSRLASAFAARYPLRVLRPPLELPPIEICQVWHRRAHDDPAIGFLRELLREAARVSSPRASKPGRVKGRPARARRAPDSSAR